ncbi:hypothetical protein H6P81_013782 [Aristolochia fimbriata]|uniref:C2 NT-type domain-containing protein n=1 Tax=Aristolochia fimbriata TaxID=158543 RepID=A0AAV7EHA4_ARIFI|nr:hypothetical protein H6P81_013782 [Aristolochia fimbriata]
MNIKKSHREELNMGEKDIPDAKAEGTTMHESTKTEKNPGEGISRGGPIFCFGKWGGGFRRPRTRSRCLVCLQVHKIKDLPLCMEGTSLVLGWRTHGWAGETTGSVHVHEGTADFDEIFLHYCTVQSPSKSFSIWVSTADEKLVSDLGTFQVDLSQLKPVQNANPKFCGKTMSFDLGGRTAEGKLSVSLYYTIIEPEPGYLQPRRCDSIGDAQEKSTTGGSKCFYCLPGLRKQRQTRLVSGSSRRVSSLNPDTSFITIENTTENDDSYEDEDEGFITIERGLVRVRSWRPPSLNSITSDDIEIEREKPHQFSGFYEESEADQVENEFLQMLEGKSTNDSVAAQSLTKVDEKLNAGIDLDLNPGLGFRLDSLLWAAEEELLKASHDVWKSNAEARELEKAEFDELVKMWRSNKSSNPPLIHGGFGSPV